MKVAATAIPDVLLLEPEVFSDARGFLFESYRQDLFRAATGLAPEFVQDNHARSTRGVLRGLHYQVKQSQGKLVRVVLGSIFDVAVDLRRESPTFGRWVGAELSADNRCQMWLPPGFAHGYLTLSEVADVVYKATDYYAPQHERCIAWNDPGIGISWPLGGAPVLSEKDTQGVLLSQADTFVSSPWAV